MRKLLSRALTPLIGVTTSRNWGRACTILEGARGRHGRMVSGARCPLSSLVSGVRGDVTGDRLGLIPFGSLLSASHSRFLGPLVEVSHEHSAPSPGPQGQSPVPLYRSGSPCRRHRRRQI